MKSSKDNTLEKPRPRTLARECVFKVIFASRISESNVLEELDAILEGYSSKDVDKPFARLLGSSFQKEHQQAQEALKPLMHLQRAAALNDVEESLLLLAAVEILCHPETPGKVVINESVNLCKRYGTADGYKFINAVLDALLRQVTGGANKE